MVVLMQELQEADLFVECQKMDRATKNIPPPYVSGYVVDSWKATNNNILGLQDIRFNILGLAKKWWYGPPSILKDIEIIFLGARAP